MTRLLLERGANPNDIEAVYHSPETYDNEAMKLLVETGKLSADNLSLMLIRKHAGTTTKAPSGCSSTVQAPTE